MPAAAPSHIVILYVEDPVRSRRFYEQTLGMSLVLDAGNYFEFAFGGAHLGLLARKGLPAMIGAAGARPWTDGAPRAEIYLRVEDLDAAIVRLHASGARCLSPLASRDWGDRAAYFEDPDGHVVVVAKPENSAR